MTTTLADPVTPLSERQAAAPSRRLLRGFPARSRTTIHGWPAIAFGTPFAAVGAIIVLVGLKVIPVQASSVHAPYWVIAMVGAIFAIAGLFLLVHGGEGVIRRRRAARLRIMHPTSPWLADHDWDQDGSSSARPGRLLHHVFGFSFMALFLAPFHWWAVAGGGGLFVGTLIGLFDLILLVGLGYGVMTALRRAKYGTVRFIFDRFPYQLGAPVTGRLVVARGLRGLDTLTCVLRCVEEAYETHGTGEDRKQVVVCYELHAESIELAGPFDATLAADGIPLVFDAPADLPPTTMGDRPPRYWDLEVRGEAPGLDITAHLLVPLYAAA